MWIRKINNYVKKDLKILGIIYILESLVGFIVMIPAFFLFISEPNAKFVFNTFSISSASLGTLLLVYRTFFSIIEFYYGISVMVPKKWTTGFIGYIIALLQLTCFPIGTIIALYTLFTLTKLEIENEIF